MAAYRAGRRTWRIDQNTIERPTLPFARVGGDGLRGQTQPREILFQPDKALRRDALTNEADGYSAARSLIDGPASFDAIFAASDLIAIGAMRALAEAGLSVPADVAIVGFDDIPAAGHTSPPLTTLMQDIRGAGTALLDVLTEAIESDAITRRQLPARLVVRASTGTGPAAPAPPQPPVPPA